MASTDVQNGVQLQIHYLSVPHGGLQGEKLTVLLELRTWGK